ncbi:MAG: UDP-3-O-(3-hydroxymyristoyl)glucosamine N-acyltransferase [Planctomycetes bacterium]|nr:UDP-3-O-(3-hydroxymyristoyl)glucosamine N-acyltransferase [Planctomycetota bacterium]
MELHRTVAEIAALVQGRVSGPSARSLACLRAPERAGPDDLAPVFRDSARRALESSRAGTLLVHDALELPDVAGRTLIRVPDPEAALDAITAACGAPLPLPEPGVHPKAVVEPGARLGDDVRVGPLAYVGRGARIGRGSVLWPQVYVGDGATIGDDARLHPGAYVGAGSVLGARVVLRPGSAVGSEGFGFRQDAQGRHVRSPQVGTVVLGDDVEIGSHSTVDRARFETTRIGAGTKIDALVHVGHNCTFGEHTIIAGHCAFAGGATVGSHVMMGGMSGVNGMATVADGTLIGSYTLIDDDTRGGGEVLKGIPSMPLAHWTRQVLSLRRLPGLIATVRDLARRKDDRGA